MMALRACAAAWVALACLAAADGASAQSARVLVMPLDVEQPSARTAWLGEGTAIVIADYLAAAGVSTVAREERVDAFEDLRLPPAGTLTRATMIRVGEVIGASDLVVGRVALGPTGLTVHVRMLRLEAGTFLPEASERGSASDFFRVVQAAARRLAESANFRSVPVAPAAAAQGLEAFERYVKGVTADTPKARVTLLRSALQADGRFDRARLALWDAHAETGDHAAALDDVEAVPAASPYARRARFRAAWSLIELKRYDEAFDRLTDLLAGDATAMLHNNLGVVQLRRGATPQTGRATYYFTKASDLDPDDPDYCFNLGYAYWLERDAAAANYWLREAVRRNPLDADAHFVLAAALTSSGASVEAQRERELAGRLSSRYEEANRRGTTDVPKGLERLKNDLVTARQIRFDASIKAAAQRDSQELAGFYLERGRRLIEQQHDADALTELRRALYLSPYEAEAHLLMGRAYRRLGRIDAAVTALRMSLWSHESAAAHFALAEALAELRDTAGARSAAQRALVLDPGLAAARQLLAALPPQ
jgi:tetratricopeptide (TPR) repeat protein